MRARKGAPHPYHYNNKVRKSKKNILIKYLKAFETKKEIRDGGYKGEGHTACVVDRAFLTREYNSSFKYSSF